jgi:hypothetical protein
LLPELSDKVRQAEQNSLWKQQLRLIIMTHVPSLKWVVIIFGRLRTEKSFWV